MKKRTAALLTTAAIGGLAAWGYAEALMSVTTARNSPIQKLLFKKKKLSPHQQIRAVVSERLKQQPVRDVVIKSRDGLSLRGHWYPCKNPKRVLIMAHGWHSAWHRDFGAVAPFLHENGCSLLFIDQRTHGESDGKYISYGILERFDLCDWLTFLSKKIPESVPIYFMGISMGAATALMAAGLPGTERLSGIIADCGFSNPYDIVERTIAGKIKRPRAPIEVCVMDRLCRKRANFSLKDHSPRKAMEQNENIPVLFIHGGADDFVPCAMTLENYMACRAPKSILIVPGAGHSMSYIANPRAYEQKLCEFWEKYDR